jgi:hypothetical protein
MLNHVVRTSPSLILYRGTSEFTATHLLQEALLIVYHHHHYHHQLCACNITCHHSIHSLLHCFFHWSFLYSRSKPNVTLIHRGDDVRLCNTVPISDVQLFLRPRLALHKKTSSVANLILFFFIYRCFYTRPHTLPL